MLLGMDYNEFMWRDAPELLGRLTALLIVFAICRFFGLTGLLVGILGVLVIHSIFPDIGDPGGPSRDSRGGGQLLPR